LAKEASAYKEGQTWSMRRRIKGHDLYVSGHRTKTLAQDAMKQLVDPLLKRGQPKGDGPLQTTLGRALQNYALERLPFRKGAVQDANRINRWLRALNLQTLKVVENKDENMPGLRFLVTLQEPTCERVIPQGLGAHRQALAERASRSDKQREYLARQPVGKLIRADVQALIDALQAEGKKSATVEQEQAVLRGFYNYAATVWNWSAPAENPATKLKVIRADNARDRVMTLDEQARLDEAIAECRNELIGPTVTLYTESGMRASEPIANATWSDVDWCER
jgi:hypothetical protein